MIKGNSNKLFINIANSLVLLEDICNKLLLKNVNSKDTKWMLIWKIIININEKSRLITFYGISTLKLYNSSLIYPFLRLNYSAYMHNNFKFFIKNKCIITLSHFLFYELYFIVIFSFYKASIIVYSISNLSKSASLLNIIIQTDHIVSS